MVKGTKRRDEEYFQKMERDMVRNPEAMGRVLTIGLIVLGGMFLINAMVSYSEVPETSYEKGLGITYVPETSDIQISYLNLYHDTSLLAVKIYTQYYSPYPMLVYDYQTDKYPVELFYKPNKDSVHTVLVTTTKTTGNYTHVYKVNPKQRDNMWKNFMRYFEELS